MSRGPELARRLFDRLEPIHVVSYFAAEVREALADIGFDDFWTGYVASRSAPLGKVPSEVVAATFFNFSAGQISRAVSAAWDVAEPDVVLQTRLLSSASALARCGLTDDDGNVNQASRLAKKAAIGAPLHGRALFAANLSLSWPESPVAALWHAATLLREHRGDGHVAALTAAGINGRESNVLHAAAGLISRATISQLRDYDDTEWELHEHNLARRGLLEDDGSLSNKGRQLKDFIEKTTDELALSALDQLSDDEVEQLFQAVTPLTNLVIAGGDVPSESPQSMRRNGLDDASANIY